MAEILVELLAEVTFDRKTLNSHETNYQLNRNNRVNYRYIKIQTVKIDVIHLYFIGSINNLLQAYNVTGNIYHVMFK